jgi:hypothetical protein
LGFTVPLSPVLLAWPSGKNSRGRPMPRSTHAARPRLVAAFWALAPARLLTTARWLLHDKVFTQGTSVERLTFWARFQGWECTGDVGRHATVEQLTGAVATDSNGCVRCAGVDLRDPRSPVDLSDAWCSGGVTLGGRVEAARGEVVVVAGGNAVEGFSNCRL